MRVLVLFALLALVLPDDAEACSCVQRSFAENVKAAKLVMLARAGKPEKKGDALAQSFTVLATLKGPATKQWLFDRPATPPCASSYAENEVALLFTSGSDLDPCHGNGPLGSQIAELDKILDATGTKRGDAKGPAVEAALRHALAKYTHGRAKISVQYAPLAGTSFAIDKSTLAYAKTLAKDAVVIAKAFATDSLALVEGYYNREGVRFTVLLDKTGAVVWSSVAER